MKLTRNLSVAVIKNGNGSLVQCNEYIFETPCITRNLFGVAVLELGRSQNVVDVVDDFAVQHHRTVLLVALRITSTCNRNK